MKSLQTTFIDIESGKPIGPSIEGLIVPTFPGMVVENFARVRYAVKTAELLDSIDSLNLFVNVSRLAVQT